MDKWAAPFVLIILAVIAGAYVSMKRLVQGVKNRV